MERKNVILLVLFLFSVMGVIIYMSSNGFSIGQLKLGSGRENEAKLEPPIVSRARVAVNSLYLREGPGIEFVATYLLPKGWAVSYLGDSKPDNSGNIWVKVLVQTEQGPRDGWVNRNYLRPATER